MKFSKQPRRAGKCCRKLSEWSEKLQNQAKSDCVFGEQKHVCWRMVENPPDSSQKPVEAPQIPVKHKYGAHACPLLLVLPGKVLQQGASFPSAQLELRTAELPGFNSTFSLPLTSRHLIMCFSMTPTLLTQVPHRAGHGRGGAQPCGHRPSWPVCGRGQPVPLGEWEVHRLVAAFLQVGVAVANQVWASTWGMAHRVSGSWRPCGEWEVHRPVAGFLQREEGPEGCGGLRPGFKGRGCSQRRARSWAQHGLSQKRRFD